MTRSMSRGSWIGVLLVGAALGAWATTSLPRAHAEGASALPSSCERGQLVVVGGDGRLSCASPKAALGLSGCSVDEFVFAGPFGELRCKGVSTAGNARALLPSCSTGQVLQSDGGGSWRCVSPPPALPSCSSGQILVSEGSSSWRCAAPPK